MGLGPIAARRTGRNVRLRQIVICFLYFKKINSDLFSFRRLPAEKEDLKNEGLMTHKDFVVFFLKKNKVLVFLFMKMRETEKGEVCCFDRLEAALTEAELVVEAVAEDLQAKQELFESD